MRTVIFFFYSLKFLLHPDCVCTLPVWTESWTLRVLMMAQRGDTQKTTQSVRRPLLPSPKRRGRCREFRCGFPTKVNSKSWTKARRRFATLKRRVLPLFSIPCRIPFCVPFRIPFEILLAFLSVSFWYHFLINYVFNVYTILRYFGTGIILWYHSVVN